MKGERFTTNIVTNVNRDTAALLFASILTVQNVSGNVEREIGMLFGKPGLSDNCNPNVELSEFCGELLNSRWLDQAGRIK